LDLFDLTESLIKIKSPTGQESEVTAFLEDYLRGMGFEIILQDVNNGRNNILARIGDPVVVMTTHQDTVSPDVPFSQDAEYIYGRGACDAKGIIASQIKAAEELLDQGADHFGLLFVVDEESGSEGARIANSLTNRCQFIINGEPTENKLAKGSKGALRFELFTHGRAAHSAYPDQGESAILKLMDVLTDLRKLSFPSDPVLGKTDMNIGTISGGIQANVMPDFAKAELMFRTATDTANILEILKRIIENRAQLSMRFFSNPVFLETLENFDTTIVSFATDIPLLTNWGKPFLVGPGSILDAHSPDEHIAKTSLVDAVSIYSQMVQILLND